MYPAGYSDEEFSDSDDDFRPSWTSMPKKTNGQPKKPLEIILQRDMETAITLVNRTKSSDREEFLVLCCSYSWFQGVEYLLRMDVPVDCCHNGQTPLIACCRGWDKEGERVECIKQLLKHKANINFTTKDFDTPLLAATDNGHLSIVKLLTEQAGIQLNERNKYGETALLVAAKRKNMDLIEILKQAGANIEVKTQSGLNYMNLLEQDEEIIEEPIPELTVRNIFNPLENKTSSLENSENSGMFTGNIIFLDELPDDNGNGGFTSDAKLLLIAAGCENINLSINLPDLLTATDEQLEALGVKITAFRSDILSEIHRFHKKEWTAVSLPIPARRTEEVVMMSATLLKHLTIMNASIKYTGNHLLKSGECKRELFNTLCETKCTLDRVRLRLQRYQSVIEQKYGGTTHPPDWILPKNEKKENRIRYSYLIYGGLLILSVRLFINTYFCY